MKEIYKDWIRTILVLSLLWAVGNAVIVGFSLLSDGEFLGETTFWGAYWVSMIFEFGAIVGAGIVAAAFVWLFKSILKGKIKS